MTLLINKKIIFNLSVICFITVFLSGYVLADDYMRKSGSIVASWSDPYIRINGAIAGEFDGEYVRKSGSIIGEIDGDYIRKNGSIIYEIDNNGYVRKNGSIYLEFDGYDGTPFMKKVIAAYLFFFDY